MQIRLSSVLSAEELLDVAFGRASKAGKGVVKRARKSKTKRAELERIKIASAEIKGRLDSICSEASEILGLSGFYEELVGAMIDMQKLERSFNSLKGASKTVQRMESTHRRLIMRTQKEGEIYSHRKAFYGKVSSLINKIDAELEFLKEVRRGLKKLPTVEDTFTIVIAGLPNVGKSSLMKAITGSEPRVESYPFTTQHILIGHFEHRYQRIQVIDTPGLLDRSIEKRNKVEKRAVLALSYLADVIVYLFDLTETCGFPANEQINLYSELKTQFEIPIVPLINKSDLLEKEELEGFRERLGAETLACSATEGTGVDVLVERALSLR